CCVHMLLWTVCGRAACCTCLVSFFFFSSRRRHTRCYRDWSSDVCSSDLGAHHHGEVESVIYVVSGRARMRWGERLEFVAEAGPGDFIYVPPFVPHQEINANREEPLSCVLVRSGQEPVVVNLEIAPAEPPEEGYWVDDIHSP